MRPKAEHDTRCCVPVRDTGGSARTRPTSPGVVSGTPSPSGTRRPRPSRRRCGIRQRTLRRHVAQRIAAFVAIGRGIRKRAGSRTVQHDQDDAPVSAGHRQMPRQETGPPLGNAVASGVAGDGAPSFDGGDRVLEDQMIRTVDLHDHRRSDRTCLMRARDDGRPSSAGRPATRVASRGVQEDILDGGRADDVGRGSDKPEPSERCFLQAFTVRSRRQPLAPHLRQRLRILARAANHIRLGSLRNQINCRRA